MSRTRRATIEREIQMLTGNQIFLAAQTVAELRYWLKVVDVVVSALACGAVVELVTGVLSLNL